MRKFLTKCLNCGSTRQSMPRMTETICPDCGAEREYLEIDDSPRKQPQIQAQVTSPNLEKLRTRITQHDTVVKVKFVPGDDRFDKVQIINADGKIVASQG